MSRRGNFWDRLARGIPNAVHTYQVLQALIEAEKRREEDARQFDEQLAQRSHEFDTGVDQWRAENQQEERKRAQYGQQLGIAGLTDAGLRGPPGVLQDVVQPPDMATYYGGRFAPNLDIQPFGGNQPNPDPGFTAPYPSSLPNPDPGFTAPYRPPKDDLGFGLQPLAAQPDVLDAMRSANQQTRDRQATEALQNFDDMQRQLGERQIVARQLMMERPSARGGPMLLEDPAITQRLQQQFPDRYAGGVPAYGEFRGLGQEDIAAQLRPDEMSPNSARIAQHQMRQDAMEALRNRRLLYSTQAAQRQAQMQQILKDPSQYDPQIHEFVGNGRAAYDAAQREYSAYMLELNDLDNRLGQYEEAMFPGLFKPKPSTAEGPPPPPPPVDTSPSGPPGVSFPDPMPGEDGEMYLRRMKDQHGANMRDPRTRSVLHERLRRFGLILTGTETPIIP